jgi:hypothetical protein
MAVDAQHPIVSALQRLKSAYPRTTIKPETMKEYYRALKEYEPADVELAIDRIIANLEWWPSIAEIVREIKSVQTAQYVQERSAADSATRIANRKRMAELDALFAEQPADPETIRERMRANREQVAARGGGTIG